MKTIYIFIIFVNITIPVNLFKLLNLLLITSLLTLIKVTSLKEKVLSIYVVNVKLGTIHLVQTQNFPENYHFSPPDTPKR